MANVTVIVGVSILTLVFVATVLSVVFATRGAMGSNRDVVSVLHYSGLKPVAAGRGGCGKTRGAMAGRRI
jgi:hypothetical protein